MSSNLSIVRDTRVRDRLASAGQTVFTFDAPLFDAADLKVFVQAAPGLPFVEHVSGFAVALLEDNVGGQVTFAVPPLPVGGAGSTVVRLKGQRTHERLTDVTRGGVVRSMALEAEFDRSAVVLQELRRDINEFSPFVDVMATSVLAAAQSAAAAAGSATVAGTHANNADASAAEAANEAAHAHSAADSATTTILALAGALREFVGAVVVDANGHLIATYSDSHIAAVAVDDDTGRLTITYGETA